MIAEALFAEHREDTHGDHDGYSDETLQRAIIQGVDAGGDRLDGDMPRWAMSEQDIGALVVSSHEVVHSILI